MWESWDPGKYIRMTALILAILHHLTTNSQPFTKHDLGPVSQGRRSWFTIPSTLIIVEWDFVDGFQGWESVFCNIPKEKFK